VKVMVSVLLSAVMVSAGSAYAQTGDASAKAAAAQRQSRYQIGQMERVLEGAVEHGITNIRERLQALGPTELLISNNARARGFRLDGYGMFFDVVAPSFDTTVLWSMRALDQNDLGLESALRALQSYVKAAGDANLDQALRRVELQVNPVLLARAASPAVAGARNLSGSAASTNVDASAQAIDPILTDPNEAYRAEVTQALMDALLDHSSSLGLGPADWLTIAVRRNDERPQLAPADSDARTFIIRLKGSDLVAFLARQITRDEALKRIEVRVF
jgi:hypothetical protein